MSATHDRLIRLLEYGRSDIEFESATMQDWQRGWNASIKNAIRAIQTDIERAALLADYADWTTAELAEVFGK